MGRCRLGPSRRRGTLRDKQGSREGGETLDYTLKRSKRKTIAIQVSRELNVIVRAPHNLPKSRIEETLRQHEGWINAQLKRQRAYQSAFPEPSEKEAEALTQAAKEYLPLRVAHFARIMGLTPNKVRITSAKGRFGSCSQQNNLCFSYRLMLRDEGAIDYVVVHELAHFVHKNHQREFYQLVESVLPDWRERRARLLGRAPEAEE